MGSLREKLERVHSLLINEENEQAELLFHEAFVEAAREIHKKIMEEDEWLDEPSDEELVDGEECEESFDEVLEADEEGDEEVADIVDEEADEEGDEEVADMSDEEADEEGDEEVVDMDDNSSVEDKIAELEAELEALKAEFEELQADEMDEPEHDDIFGNAEGDEDVDGEEMSDDSEEDEMKTEEYDALDESFELESVSNNNSESTIGSGKGFEPSLNKTSPIPQKKVGDRIGGKAVDPTKGKEHKGYDREASPTVQQMEKRKNVRSRAEEDMSKVSKEGDASAAINKTESEFGKGNVKSPIGSKGTVQAKGLTESRKRKA